MLSLLSKSCCNVFSHSVDESDQLCIGFQPDASFVDFGTILFACLHHMLPQLSFFLCFCLSYLFLWEQICSRFHAGGRKRRPNLGFFSCFSLFYVIVFCILMHDYLCSVSLGLLYIFVVIFSGFWFLFHQYQPRRSSLKWPILCQVECKSLINQSINRLHYRAL